MSENTVRPRDPKERETRCRVCGGNHEYGKATCNQWWKHRVPRTASLDEIVEWERKEGLR